MHKQSLITKHDSIITREVVTVGDGPANKGGDVNECKQTQSDPQTVLVINASHQMAKEMTFQLSLHLPRCSILYAPTLELARHILSRRPVNLVIASPMLPDGGIERMKNHLLSLECPPDLVVIKDVRRLPALRAQSSEQPITRVSPQKLSASSESSPIKASPTVKETVIRESLRNLGADIRNDLNNPLQEIVAMVFVVKSGDPLAPSTSQALQAIDLAAKNMASYVNSLEEKIRSAVTPHSKNATNRLAS